MVQLRPDGLEGRIGKNHPDVEAVPSSLGRITFFSKPPFIRSTIVRTHSPALFNKTLKSLVMPTNVI